MTLRILYRGPLSSCNYACHYCPFAKRKETSEQLAQDRNALENFCNWVERQQDRTLGILFTPWGEALVRKWYRDSIIRLSRLSNVERVAIQTNLSPNMRWVQHVDTSKVAFWATYHPEEAKRDSFIERCRYLDSMGVRYSVGIVGLKEHFREIRLMRDLLKDHVYLWVNAYKRIRPYYDENDLEYLRQIDPFFDLNNTYHDSQGHQCLAGEEAVSVDGEGVVRRCHFIKEPLGNIYSDGLSDMLRKRSCSNATCGCHIGYVHMPELRLYQKFEGGILERIPAGFKADSPAQALVNINSTSLNRARSN